MYMVMVHVHDILLAYGRTMLYMLYGLPNVYRAPGGKVDTECVVAREELLIEAEGITQHIVLGLVVKKKSYCFVFLN